MQVFVCVNQFTREGRRKKKKEKDLILIVNIFYINILNLGSQHDRLSSWQAS